MNPIELGSATHTLEIESRLDQIEVALNWLRELGAKQGWPDRALFSLVLSADEALTNIVAHAAGVEQSDVTRGVSTSVRLVCTLMPQELSLRIEDEGPEFDPTQVDPDQLPESIEEAAVGGHGIRLMHHYLKSIHYVRQGRRNVLTLQVDAKF
ncbi:MAG: ATP-binding protein [Comamonadaceae bacterium]|nr:ATP-binding protein [Comamonadaceae bacterium]